MISVRKASRTTVALYIFISAIVVLTRMSTKWDIEIINRVNLLLGSRPRIGTLHSIVLAISFWLLLIASAVDAVYHEKTGLSILGAFGIPIVFSGCMAIWALISMSIYVDLRWFWLFYYVMMLISTKRSFNKVSLAKGGGSSNIKVFFKTPPTQCDADVSIIDRYVLFSTKAILLVFWFFQITMTLVFCIQYREIFPFT